MSFNVFSSSINNNNSNNLLLKIHKTKSKDKKSSIIIEFITKLFSSYYENFIEIFNIQTLQFLKRWQNNNDPLHSNYIFKKIIKIHRQRLETELNHKFEEFNKLILNDKNFEDLNLEENIDINHLNDYYSEQIKSIDSSMEKLIINIKNVFDQINENLDKKANQDINTHEFSDSDPYLTDFSSDTEFEVRRKHCGNSNESKLINLNYNSETELDNIVFIKNTESEEATNLETIKFLVKDEDNESILTLSNYSLNISNSSNNLLNSMKFNNNRSIKFDNNKPKLEVNLGMTVFAVKDEFFHRWQPARITRIAENASNETVYSIQFDNKYDIKKLNKNKLNLNDIDSNNDNDDFEIKLLTATCIAYSEPVAEDGILQIRTRIVALYRNENDKKAPFFSVGTICELPNPRNLNRYLVFFDDGYAQYVKKQEAFPVFDPFTTPDDSLNRDHLKFLQRYFENYPKKAMVRLRKDNILKTFYNGKWHTSRVIEIDCSLVKLHFEEINHYEWLYRGSYRLHPFYEKLLQEEYNKKSNSSNKMVSMARQHFGNVSHSHEFNNQEQDENSKPYQYISPCASTLFPTAKKQTARKTLNAGNINAVNNNDATDNNLNDIRQQIIANNLSNQNAASKIQQGQIRILNLEGIIRNERIKFKNHPCTAGCVAQWEKFLNNSKSFNRLLVPVFCGWQRQVCTESKESSNRSRKTVYYIAPCGRRLRSINDIDRYLFLTNSYLTLDMFSYDIFIHIDREFEANSRYLYVPDITDGKDDIPISCVNCVDFTKPESFEYSKVRVPLEGVPLNTDLNNLEGCDCEDGCREPMKCACWRKTFEATTFINRNQVNTNVGYRGRRLPEMVNTGIFECNSKCKCDKRCSNRVVQNGTSVRLQLFKTSQKKGWGLRCLDDVAKGSFICIYTGHLITEEQSDIRGANLGDEYFAELDFVECLKRLREGNYSDSDSDDDIANNKFNNEFNSKTKISSGSEKTLPRNDSNVIEYIYLNSDDDDCKFQPSNNNNSTMNVNNINGSNNSINNNLSNNNNTNGCSLQRRRRPINFRNTSLGIIDSHRFFTNPKNSFYFKDYLKNSAVYIMDAKICGNIGRYFNHSCSPNIFVQNVFVDTYDLRFPWIAFFASQYIRAGTELCWDYNYTINSVEGRVLFCYCGSSSCRGRLL